MRTHECLYILQICSKGINWHYQHIPWTTKKSESKCSLRCSNNINWKMWSMHFEHLFRSLIRSYYLLSLNGASHKQAGVLCFGQKRTLLFLQRVYIVNALLGKTLLCTCGMSPNGKKHTFIDDSFQKQSMLVVIYTLLFLQFGDMSVEKSNRLTMQVTGSQESETVSGSQFYFQRNSWTLPASQWFLFY